MVISSLYYRVNLFVTSETLLHGITVEWYVLFFMAF